ANSGGGAELPIEARGGGGGAGARRCAGRLRVVDPPAMLLQRWPLRGAGCRAAGGAAGGDGRPGGGRGVVRAGRLWVEPDRGGGCGGAADGDAGQALPRVQRRRLPAGGLAQGWVPGGAWADAAGHRARGRGSGRRTGARLAGARRPGGDRGWAGRPGVRLQPDGAVVLARHCAQAGFLGPGAAGGGAGRAALPNRSADVPCDGLGGSAAVPRHPAWPLPGAGERPAVRERRGGNSPGLVRAVRHPLPGPRRHWPRRGQQGRSLL
ncbi:MAG: Muramoyltetrapeptide carboxypeptidase, partial [uncultured Sphingomonas sp.]